MPVNDPIAQAIFDYHFKRENTPVVIYANDFDPDEVLPSYFFRTFNEMPPLEQQALQLARGKVLDVGACAGCHSIYLQEKGLDVYSLERSLLSCRVMHDRQLRQVIHADLFQYSGQQFDTILLLMNGTGIAGTLSQMDNFLQKLKSLLAPGGQILIDSSDLIYLYLDEDGSAMIDLNTDHYYGEMTYQTAYKNNKSPSFSWLYLDPDTLAEKAHQNQLKSDQIIHGGHYDYLAIIKHQ